jgi:hypothetical protein
MFASGLAAALAGRQELRTSPRPIALTRSFFAFASYAALVVVPISIYFYAFHGDWFLLYLVDVARIPSAIALVGFALEACLGAIGFVLGALLVRSQREAMVGALIGLLLLLAVAVVVLYADRLAQVGTYAQFHGQFGLSGWGEAPLLTGALAMMAGLVLGLAFMVARLWQAGRR